jgi:hypothetical protein
MANEEQLAILKSGVEAWNAWRAEHPDERIDLSRADLSQADLSWANLTQADLTEADLRRANLSQTRLSKAYLGGAMLSDADLTNANLSDADLTNANLSGADLSGAHVAGTHLTEAVRHGRGITGPVAADPALFIAARRLDMFFGTLPASHLSLVVQDEDGTEYEYEGQPERAVLGAHGRIIVTKRPYRPRPDRQPIRFPLPWGRPVSDAIAILDAEVERLNAAAVPYNLLGPNSNTVARTLLLALGLDPVQPAAVAPGFEHEAL